MRRTLALLCLALACSCAPAPAPALRVESRPEVHSADGSIAPGIASGADGRFYLSWLERADAGAHDGDTTLRFDTWTGEGWSDPRTIAAGRDWFVNWADVPAMAALADGSLIAHWLERSGPATYAYDVRLSVSHDGGESWSPPRTLHDDGTQSEHGFVSWVPTDGGRFRVVWLDGRETGEAAADDGGHGAHAGSMTLRTALLDRDGTTIDDELLDDRVCDCCPTDAILDDEGRLLAVYRDRTATEVRDISLIRTGADGTRSTTPVHDDGWLVPACPVNGPAIARAGNRIGVAWYTAAAPEGRRVLFAFSDDGGSSFAAPVRIDAGAATGRVDLMLLDERTAVVSWIEQGEVRLRTVVSGVGIGPISTVAAPGDARAAGFPRMARLDDRRILIAWTEPGPPSRIASALVTVD